MASLASKPRARLSRSSKSRSPSTSSYDTEVSSLSDSEAQSNVSSFLDSPSDSTSEDELSQQTETTHSESALSQSPPRKKLKLSSPKNYTVPQARGRRADQKGKQLVIEYESTDSDIIAPQAKTVRARAKKGTASTKPDGHESSETVATKRGPTAKYQDNFNYTNGIDESKPPLHTISDMFADLTRRSVREGLDKFLNHLAGRPLVVATMMSGTESPIITLNNVAEHLRNSGRSFNFSHVFSAEIEPFKQSYILRNFPDPIVFRDVVELNNHSGFATTAYGGMAKVPGNVDLLVAGFCCVDFSPLNTAKKTLEARGESGDTFFSIIAYAKDYHPKMIILENLSSVPWSHEEALAKQKKDSKPKGWKSVDGEPEKAGLDKHFADIGYRSIYIRVDTKDHYIPHTRVRGYMVSVHEDSFPDPAKLDVLLASWRKLIAKLKSPASVPVDAMIMSSDDPRLKMRTQKVVDPEKKVIDWERCKTGHQDYRASLGLGTRHPLTNWSSDGYVSFPDYFKPYIGRTERIFDSLEIAHLRNVRRGFDDRYFSRFYELSQNVFRVTDATKQGIIGCLTPTGTPWSSVRGGKLSGQEALMLQGLPVDQLDLDQLTQAQLQDFSGNAMTSTVVGTAMLSAFILFYDVFESGDTTTQVDHDHRSTNSRLEGEGVLTKIVSYPTEYKPVSVDKIKKLAEFTSRLCYCEGRHDVLAKSFQKCTICRHTTCVACGKTPKHQYTPISTQYLSQRQEPCVFEELIKKSIPMVIDLASIGSERIRAFVDAWHRPDGFEQKEWLKAVSQVKDAMKSKVFLRSCRRSEIWEIVYDSGDARIVLQISKNLVEWLVYANVPREPFGTSLGKFLRKHPFARMRPTGQDITLGSWNVWQPERRDFAAEITSEGQLVQSFESYCGLEAFADTMVMKTCSINVPEYDANYFDLDIRGDYELSQDCGQAFNSLHVKKNTTASAAPTFLFLDHNLQSGDPKLHSFVFTHVTRRMNYGEHRPVLAFINSKWRQPKVPRADVAEPSVAAPNKPPSISGISRRDRTTIRSEGRWIDLAEFVAKPSKVKSVSYSQLPLDISRLKIDSCQSRHAVFITKATMPNDTETSWVKDQWTAVDRTNEEKFFREFHWAIESGSVISGHQEADKNWQAVKTSHSNVRCYDCAPQTPKLLWAFSRHKKRLGKLAPFEEPEQATAYEHAMKKRPAPMTVLFNIDQRDEIMLKVGVNPHALVHRAAARLDIDGNCKQLQQSWRLVTDDGRTLKPNLTPFKLMNTKNLVLSSQPPNFNKKLLLRDFQRSSLTWMIHQERHENTFTEQEVCEARVRQLGYRLEGKVTREARALGGVLAHDVGFGKTALILALIDTMKSQDALRTQEQDTSKGSISLKASIIVVPPHLLDQWESEISRFLPQIRNEKLLVIKTIAAFQKLTINQWLKAEMVLISWKMCENPIYTSALAQFAGMMEPDEHSTVRALDVWYEGARKMVASNVDKLTADPKGFQNNLRLQARASEEESLSLEAPVPSKRTKGASYKSFVEREMKRVKNNGSETKLKLTSKDLAKKSTSIANFNLGLLSSGHPWTALSFPLLEMFDFARVVIDEYTYVAKGEGRILEHLKADSRWILSGTPALGGFWHIKKMAKLLGVNLGVDDYSSMPEDILKATLCEMTDAEQAQTFQETPSPAWQESRHLLCQKFLDQYVRKDLADVSDIFCSEYLRLVRQPPAEKAIYLELVQTMAAVDFIPKQRNAGGNEIDRHIDEALANCTDGKEALLLRASHFAVLPNTAETTEDASEDEFEESGEDSIINTATGRKQVEDHVTSPESAPKACDIVVGSRLRHYEKLKGDFCHALKQTYWLDRDEETEQCDYFTKWQQRIKHRTYGDAETCLEVERLVAEAENNYSPDDWKLFYYKGNKGKAKLAPYPTGMNNTGGAYHLPKMVYALRTMATKLNTYMGTLIKCKRALRFMETVLAVQSFKMGSLKEPGTDIQLACSKCHTIDEDPAKIVILTQCGHLVCRSKCLKESVDECPVRHCNASIKKYHQTLGSDLIEGNARGKLSQNGEKLDAVVSLIESIPNDEKVLVFVQSNNLMEKVMEAVGAKMLYSDLECLGKEGKNKGSKMAVRHAHPENARDLNAFQQPESINRQGNKIAGPRALILNIGTEAASGLNLTMANHIIFVAPYYVKGSNSQHDYEAAMTQAIGRARRYGQTKPVHIYHFMTCHTIDVDIMEHRTSCLVKPVAATVAGPSPHKGFVPSKLELVERHQDDKESTFGSAIAHMLFGAGGDE